MCLGVAVNISKVVYWVVGLVYSVVGLHH